MSAPASEEDVCAVCLEPLAPGGPPGDPEAAEAGLWGPFECGHAFHSGCARAVLQHRERRGGLGVCWVCRAPATLAAVCMRLSAEALDPLGAPPARPAIRRAVVVASDEEPRLDLRYADDRLQTYVTFAVVLMTGPVIFVALVYFCGW